MRKILQLMFISDLKFKLLLLGFAALQFFVSFLFEIAIDNGFLNICKRPLCKRKSSQKLYKKLDKELCYNLAWPPLNEIIYAESRNIVIVEWHIPWKGARGQRPVFFFFKPKIYHLRLTRMPSTYDVVHTRIRQCRKNMDLDGNLYQSYPTKKNQGQMFGKVINRAELVHWTLSCSLLSKKWQDTHC